MPLSDGDLTAFIEEHAIEAELVYPGGATPTVPAAAAALGVPIDRIIKSLVFIANGEPQLVIAAGEVLVDKKRLREILRVPRRKLTMASPEEALELTGYEVGAMPPFGHLRRLPTLLDSVTVTGKMLYGGGGTRAAMLRLRREVLLTVTRARVLPLAAKKES